MEKEFDTDVLLNVVTHFQVVSVKFIYYGQNVNKKISPKAILGKMCGIYVTDVADVDKG